MRFAQKQAISRVTTRPLRATAVCTGLVRALQTRGRGTSVRPREGPTARTHFTAQGASKKVHSVSEIITQQQRRQQRSGGKEEERAQYMALIISGTTRRHHRGRAQRTGTSDCPVEHEPAPRLSTARNTRRKLEIEEEEAAPNRPSRTVSAPTQHCSATAGFFFCARGREISRISESRSRQQQSNPFCFSL
ncbi:hypothetical protein TcCL_ESM01499 [Trypanosoma cruzi]|nr:hypothetical protein TcCL_ESM01499 [Trypanosoma cruzi]